MLTILDVIHEDDRMLVLNKPPGLVCHPTKAGAQSSLIGRIRLYLKDSAKPHLIHRLDRETSGLVMAAKTDEAARQLHRLWENRVVAKEYLAIVHGWPLQDEGAIDAPLGKDVSSRVAIKDCVRPDGAPARTEFCVERRFERQEGRFALLRVSPRTGRKHQIRIHLAHIGHPIVGDKLYGHDEDCYLALVEDRLTPDQRRRLLLPSHALHARRLRFAWDGVDHCFVAEPGPAFREFMASSPESSL